MTPQYNQEFVALLDYLARSRGFDFTGYKQAGLTRRIEKRMRMVGVSSYIDYIDYLEVHQQEFTHLFNTILINVTGFFRDPQTWEFLEREIIPRIINTPKGDEPIRVWSAGCASGEEAYSIAILLAEVLGENQFRERVKIYATDVDDDALAKARLATYTAKEVEGVPADLLEKYFIQNNGIYIFHKELRRNLIFGRNDLIQDAPISRVHLLICRNTLMYFNVETQAKIIARFHFALADNGFLFLGKAETLLTHTNTFTPVEIKLRIFSKVAKVNLRDRLLIMAHTGSEEGVNSLINLVRVRDAAFDSSPVAQVVVDLNNILILANDMARGMFSLSYRDIGRPFQDLEISYRPAELRSYIQKVFLERLPIMIKDIEWYNAKGDIRYLEIRVQPLMDNGNGSGLLAASISFVDTTTTKLLEKQREQADHELETALEELQSTNEELETTNEELQSTVEELETTNEELQSTNEELETMNEELQSTNEELHTINDELSLRTDELNRVNAFLESILTSVKDSLVVLDRDLRVQVWNRKAEDQWGLREEEALGKNFLNLDIGLPVEALKKPIRSCLAGEVEGQETTLTARNRRGRDVNMRVITAPLLGPNQEILGVITMMEESGEDEGGRDGKP